MTTFRRYCHAAGIVALLGIAGMALASLAHPALDHSALNPAPFNPAPFNPAPSDSGLITAALWILTAIVWTWLTLTALISIAHRVVPALRSRPALDYATAPWMRRALDRLLVVGLAAALTLPIGNSAASAVSPSIRTTAEPYVRGSTGPRLSITTPLSPATVPTNPQSNGPYVRGSHSGSTPHHTPSKTEPTDPSHPVPTKPTAATHTVRAGENLWTISRNELAARQRPTDTTSIARYWGELIRLNRGSLRSGNPSLIFAGEVLHLPA